MTFRLLLLTLALLGSMAVPLRADHYLPRHRVLLLNSYHPGYTWSDGIETAIRTELARTDHELEFAVEYLDTKRFRSEQIFPGAEAFLLAKYRHRQPDVLIVADDAALQFILMRRSRLFPGVPVVICGVNDFTDDMIAGQTRITGVAQDLDMAGTIDLILRFHPQVRQIAFISDSSETGMMNRQRFRQARAPFHERVNFVELSDLTHAELVAALRQLPADTVILHTTVARDRNGLVLSPEGSIALLTENTSHPFYGMLEHSIGNEGVGGIITSAALQGETAAAMALRILHGEPADRIPVVRNTPTRPMFNYPALQRYRIDEATLPEGSVVRNRPSSFYQDHTAVVWMAGIRFVLLAGLVVALLTNVLKRRQAMILLKARKNQLQQVIESMPAGVFLADRHGKVIMTNSAGARIWGGERKVGIEEYGVYKGWWADNGRPLSAEDWGMARAIRAGETSLDELIDIEAFDGERKTINHSAMPLRDVEGTIIGGLVVIQDVTERLRGERTLLALANEWQNTFDALTDAIVLLDKDFNILHCNRAFQQLVAKEPHAITGRHCWELVHHSGAPIDTCPFSRMLRDGQSATSEYAHDGRCWETRVDPIFDDNGKLYGAIHIISDITARKRAELDRQTLISQLEQRNEELEQFTYSVSHDLKTPLVTIGGFVGQLRDDLKQNNQDCLGIDLDFIESSAKQMSTLLDNLLHLARSGRVIGDPRPVNLAQTARQALELVRGVIGESTVQLDFADNLPMVPGDAERLLEVFQNLVENAAKFSRERQPPQIEIGGKVDGQQVLCWVRDNGIGIPPQYLERIFGLFERLDRSEGGTGIGLALARRIIEKHGGRIWAESDGEDRGSTLYLTLPIL
ncbi:MAG: ABC transporter substrate binding protein [Desulfuromonadales bacterium]